MHEHKFSRESAFGEKLTEETKTEKKRNRIVSQEKDPPVRRGALGPVKHASHTALL